LKRGAVRSGEPAPASEAGGDGLLDELVAARPAARERLGELTIAELVGFGDDGAPVIELSGKRAESCRALRAAALGADAVGREVVVAFEDGDVRHPIVLGVLDDGARGSARSSAIAAERAIQIDVGDERIELEVDREIVIRCGAASLTLCPDGRIVLRGSHLLSRATGSNRIKGGTVQIN
jgi:hypothetical protein